MSFATETKNELARIIPEKKCCMLAEIAAFTRFSGSVVLLGGGKFRIVMTTENPAIARHYRTLIKTYFAVDAQVEMEMNGSLHKGHRYLLTLDPEQLSEEILRETGMLMVREGMNYITDGIYDGVIPTKCCRKAYLRGAFLGAGTMNTPEKEYHLEIGCQTPVQAQDLRRLFNTFVDIHAKQSTRKRVPFVYLKSGGQILDVLAIMGAQRQYFAFEDARLRKELRSEANRKANCDQANIDKSVAAAEKHIAAIEIIKTTIGLEALPAKLQQVAQLRTEHPDLSLLQLGAMLEPPLKKSGVNNRLRKITQIAEEISDNKGY